MPEGTSALKLEDPRLPMMMLAPVPLKTAPQELQRFAYVKPAVGEVLLWESWLRHEVPMNMSEEERSRSASTMGGRDLKGVHSLRTLSSGAVWCAMRTRTQD